MNYETLLSLKKLAENPMKQQFLIKDSTCIGGLQLVLSNKDPQVVALSLQILLLLCNKYSKELSNEIGLQQQFKSLILHENLQIRTLSIELLDKIRPVSHDGSANALHNISGNNACVQRQPVKFGPSKRLFMGTSKGRTVYFLINNMLTKDDIESCRSKLIHIKGVISVTFDFFRKRCTIRIRPEVQVEQLADSIAKTGTMTAEQIIKSEFGEEKLISFDSANKENAVQKKEQDHNTSNNSPLMERIKSRLPSYLPSDEDSPVKENVLARLDGSGSPQSKNGWFSTASNFISKSFYW